MFKKTLALVLCVGLMLSLATMAFAAENDGSIVIEAENPTEKVVDKEFHPYDWDPNSGVDHTNRNVSDDGLQYVDNGKTIINFAAHDSYTYTVDVPAAGTYELQIFADSDRDTPIDCTINGAKVSVSNFLGYTNGEGYSNSAEKGVLGNVELVKGTNTLTFGISENKNHNMYTYHYVLVPVNVTTEPEALPEILKGTPTVDGKLDDLYLNSYTMSVDKNSNVLWTTDDDPDDIKATVYFLHDGEWLYMCAVVTGDSSVADNKAEDWRSDSVEVWFSTPDARGKVPMDAFAHEFLDENGDGNIYNDSNKYSNPAENSMNIDLAKLDLEAVRTENGYVVEGKVPVPYYSKSEATVGLNLQLNNIYSYEDRNTKGAAYGEQADLTGPFEPVIVALSDTAATVPSKPDDSNPKDGDAISAIVALMAVSAVGIAVVAGKKKAF